MPRQKQLSITLQKRDSRKPRIWQLNHSGLPGAQFPLGIIKRLLLVYSCSNIWGAHCSSNSCLYNMRTQNYPLWPTMTSVVMVLNLFLNLLQICIL